jgi:hypothetical protein
MNLAFCVDEHVKGSILLDAICNSIPYDKEQQEKLKMHNSTWRVLSSFLKTWLSEALRFGIFPPWLKNPQWTLASSL